MYSLKYINKLHGKRILVLGGTSGVGLAVAEGAIEHAASVIVSGSTQEKLTRALQHLQTCTSPFVDKPEISGCTCNLIDPVMQEQNLDALLQYATNGGVEKLDHVVFTAGDNIGIPKINEATIESWQALQAVRVTAPIMLAKLLPKYIQMVATSSLTLTSGNRVFKPPENWALMSAALSSIRGLNRGLAMDLQPVRVNTVFIGGIRPPTAGVLGINDEQLEKAMQAYCTKTLTHTVGTASEVAEAYLYLMKDNYATGAEVTSDGGRLLTYS
jgi:NAD(P)-dependent dehydrogenase (short-subunit alcohol dehydrogenase family)